MPNPTSGGARWSAEQRANANLIIQVGQKMGMSTRDITIGLMVAMQESTLRNLNYGDRDSAGLFQQRPSQGWGSFEQVTDPRYAASKFFQTLKGVKGRNNMALTEAAQAVQRSGFPDAYAKWASDATSFVTGAKQSGPKITPKFNPPVDPLVAASQPQDAGMGLEAPTPSIGSPQDALAATTAGGTGAPGLASPLAGVPQGAPDMGSLTDLQPFANPQEYQAVTGGGSYGQKGVDNTSKGVVEFAKQYVGTPYVWGGTDLSKGVDCSGFVQQVYKHFGINLPRVSYQQANSGTRVGLKAMKAGDLVGWDMNSRNNGADHIAIALGNGYIIEAPRPGVGVRIRRLGNDEGAWGVRLNH